MTLGVIWLITILILGVRGKLPPAKALNLEIAALYWHFVDVVWIVIFPVVYLMSLRASWTPLLLPRPTSTTSRTRRDYVKIAIILFVLTAMEVGAYEIAHREGVPLHDFVPRP